MAKPCVAWLLLSSYIVLLGISSCGIGVTVLNFGRPVKDPPVAPEINVTKGDYEYRDIRPKTPENVKEYAEATREYADYVRDPRTYLALPCGVNALVAAPLILAALCSRKIFTKTIGLYSSLALWFLNVIGIIVLQNIVDYVLDTDSSVDNPWGPYLIVLGIQIGMFVIITLQVVLAMWELRQQKAGWPTIHFSHLFTLNTIFLVARITVLAFTLGEFTWSRLWTGLHNPAYEDFYGNYNYWTEPRMKYPECYFFPTLVAFLYCLIVAVESVLSHIIGYTHTNMLWFTSLVSAVLFCGIAVVVSPAFIKAVLMGKMYGPLMNWSIGSLCLCLVHAIAVMVVPKVMSTPPAFIMQASSAMMSSSVSSNGERIFSAASTFQSKLKGSSILRYNVFILVLNSVSMLIMIIDFPWFWGGKLMLCSNFAIMNRFLPAVVMEVVTQKVESSSALKELIHFLVETVTLIVGVIASFDWFRDGIGFAIFINMCVIIIQVVKMVRTPGFKSAAVNLAEQEVTRSDIQSLVSESDGGSESLQNDQESGRIYQPLA